MRTLVNSPFMALLNKEIKEHLKAPLIYILSALFLMITGWLFFNYIVLSKEITSTTIFQSVLVPIYGNVHFIFIFLVPLLTMRAFSSEESQGTLHLLLRSKLSEWQIVLAKYLALVFVVAFMATLTISFPLVLLFSGYFHLPSLVAIYSGLLLSLSSYLAIGLFASSLTRSAILSAVISFSLLFLMMLLSLTTASSANPMVAEIGRYMSVAFHYENFLNATITSFSVLYYLSSIVLTLLATTIVIKAKSW